MTSILFMMLSLLFEDGREVTFAVEVAIPDRGGGEAAEIDPHAATGLDRGAEFCLFYLGAMFHYTNRVGFNAIRAQVVWLFRAAQPPSEHPFGAYFTDLDETTHNLANRLRIPKEKIEYFFEFTDAGDLEPIKGSRGLHIFYSPMDYPVAPDRQLRLESVGTEGARRE